MAVIPFRIHDIESMRACIRDAEEWIDCEEVESIVCVAIGKDGNPLLTHSIANDDLQAFSMIGLLHHTANHLANQNYNFQEDE